MSKLRKKWVAIAVLVLCVHLGQCEKSLEGNNDELKTEDGKQSKKSSGVINSYLQGLGTQSLQSTVNKVRPPPQSITRPPPPNDHYDIGGGVRRRPRPTHQPEYAPPPPPRRPPSEHRPRPTFKPLPPLPARATDEQKLALQLLQMLEQQDRRQQEQEAFAPPPPPHPPRRQPPRPTQRPFPQAVYEVASTPEEYDYVEPPEGEPQRPARVTTSVPMRRRRTTTLSPPPQPPPYQQGSGYPQYPPPPNYPPYQPQPQPGYYPQPGYPQQVGYPPPQYPPNPPQYQQPYPPPYQPPAYAPPAQPVYPPPQGYPPPPQPVFVPPYPHPIATTLPPGPEDYDYLDGISTTASPPQIEAATPAPPPPTPPPSPPVASILENIDPEVLRRAQLILALMRLREQNASPSPANGTTTTEYPYGPDIPRLVINPQIAPTRLTTTTDNPDDAVQDLANLFGSLAVGNLAGVVDGSIKFAGTGVFDNLNLWLACQRGNCGDETQTESGSGKPVVPQNRPKPKPIPGGGNSVIPHPPQHRYPG